MGYSLPEVLEMSPERRAQVEESAGGKPTDLFDAADWKRVTGGQIYDYLATELSEGQPPSNYRRHHRMASAGRGQASDLLRAAGVPGLVQGRDEPWRSTGKNTHNFAVFDDKRIQTVAKFAKEPPFYSAVERHVQNLPLKAAAPDQWKATLSNAPGVKREELEWTRDQRLAGPPVPQGREGPQGQGRGVPAG